MKMFLSMVTCLSHLPQRVVLLECVPEAEIHGMTDACLPDGHLALDTLPCSSEYGCMVPRHPDNAVLALAQLIYELRENP